MSKTKYILALITGILIFFVTIPFQAIATPITFNGSDGLLSASATFDIVGGNLKVTLTNTSTNDVLAPSDVLTALFFSITGDPELTKISAIIDSGSTYYFDTTPPVPVGGDVGSEWAYKNGLSMSNGATQGISSSGLGLFGPSDRFDTSHGSNYLDFPADPDGLNYGILSAGDIITTGNAKVTGGTPLIKNSVIFTLGGLPSAFSLNQISSVLFQYGTGLSEPQIVVTNVRPTPEPTTIILLGAGILGLAIWQRKKQ
ncbi:MAG: PEP-CTERM sorting domain-containing protein [Candidatus Schekmanbacteria bacterium]|nr:PEP-CTERM sorting domain-containing protein [Candidatus Schekmanbacteria bacterium]